MGRRLLKKLSGICIKDNLVCEGSSLICRLNPTETNPVYTSSDLSVTGDKPFYNKLCSNFKKEEYKQR